MDKEKVKEVTTVFFKFLTLTSGNDDIEIDILDILLKKGIPIEEIIEITEISKEELEKLQKEISFD